MPKEEEWTQFFDPEKALSLLGLNHKVVNVADFGCGYGTFTIPAAKIIAGKIYAFDIEPEMIEAIGRRVKALSLGNVEAILRDFLAKGSGLKDGSVDYVFLFNILHLEKPEGSTKRSLTEFWRLAVGLELFTGTMTPQPPEVRQWIFAPDLNNAEDGLNRLGLFLKKSST